MYFLFFKLHSWGKRFGSSRRRFIQRFLRKMSFRASAHTGVRIPSKLRASQKNDGDCEDMSFLLQ